MRASLVAVVSGLLLGACYAAPPAPAAPGQLGACHPGAYASLSEHACQRDDDCLLCASPDACTLTTRRALSLSNAPCPRPTACDGATAACCEGRCVRSLGPPPL